MLIIHRFLFFSSIKRICYSLVMGILLLCWSENASAQKLDLNFGLGVSAALHGSSSFVSTGFLTKEEFTNIFAAPNYYFTPELGVDFRVTIAQVHSITFKPSLVYYPRIQRVEFPIMLGYNYEIFKKESTPYLKLGGGYAFSLSKGFVYEFGLGYRWKKLSAEVMYRSQGIENSALENGEFVSMKVSSISVGIRYNFYNIFGKKSKK